MRAKTQGRHPSFDPRFKSANEAWKAQWDTLLAWSTMAAVAVHAAVFAFSPGWDDSDRWLDPDLELLGSTWMVLYAPPVDAGDAAGGGFATPFLALLEEADSIPAEEVDPGASFRGSRLAQTGFSERLRERLAGRLGPVPTLVQFSSASGPPGPGDDPADTREEEELQTLDDPSTEDLALLLETTPLDLSRLSAVRPQIVLSGTSAWILIRNPNEVDLFMSRVDSRMDSEAEGLVDVAVWIDEWGSVEWAEVSRSSGRQEMDEVALVLFNEVASFRPARARGVRVSMSVIFSVPFPW